MIGNTLRLGALAIALMAGSAAVPAYAKTKAPTPAKMTYSKAFQTAAVVVQKSTEAAKTRADVVAATTNYNNAATAYNASRGEARVSAKTALDSALAALGATLSAEKTQLEAAFAAIGNQDDRYSAGSLAIGLGTLAKDVVMQRRGVDAMIASGRPTGAELGRLQFYSGQFAYDAKEYAAARTAFQAAISSGYRENDIDILLAEAYMSDNQVAQGLTVLKQAIDYRNTTPNKAPANWYRRGLGASYKAKLLEQATDFGMSLVRAYPSTDNWAGAISVVREIGKFPPQETLDLMRLMGRTKSFVEDRDYVDYIQAADPRRLPGEVLGVLDTARAAGKLTRSDLFINESRTVATSRVAADRATLPSYERDARAPSATVATIIGAADTFLSYGDAAKAESLYNIALAKPGGNTPQVLNRLGIAQVDQGNYAGAQATLAKITGPRKYIAQLWSIYAAQKAATPGT
jgi:tetratricopeptide (TPR) repeat protein